MTLQRMYKSAKSLLVCLLVGLSLTACQTVQATEPTSPPPLYENAWNFILVPSFEVPAAKTNSNNLSVTGLNHSLRFAQMLNIFLAGKEETLKGIYAYTGTHDTNAMAPLESIEPFAVLNNRDVRVSSLDAKNPQAYNAPAVMMPQFLGSQLPGTYVMAGSVDMVRAIAKGLIGKDAPPLSAGDYLVVSGPAGALTAHRYNDGISADATYPTIALPPRTQACANSFAPITIPAPAGLKVYPNQTVYMVRHVEAHPTGSFENGNYVCQGQWRALGANGRLSTIMGGVPDHVFTSNPRGLIDCAGGCSYIRPTLTVAPFAIENGLPLTLAQFQWNDPVDLAESLFNQDSPYFDHDSGASILVGWEHGNIVKAVQYLVGGLYQNPKAAAVLPAWPYTDYDTVWILSTDADGTLTMSSSCEHIPTAALPNTCPAFWQ
jgi:hypothetical protein